MASLPILLACSAEDQRSDVNDAEAGAGDASVDAGAAADAGEMVPAVPPADADGLWLGSARGTETNNDSSFEDALTCFCLLYTSDAADE